MMSRLVVRPRWLLLSGLLVVALLAVSVSTGMAFGKTPPVSSRGAGLGSKGQGACVQPGFDGQNPSGAFMTNATDAIAAALNVTVRQLQQEIASGKSLSRIIDGSGMSSVRVADTVVAQQQDQLDQQVAGGRMTLDQEDAMLAALRAQVDDVLSGKAQLVFGPGQPGGFGNQTQGRGRLGRCGG